MTVPAARPQPGFVIESPRLRLREIRGDDAPLILEVLTDADFVANVGSRGVHDLASARRYITDAIRASYRSYGFGMYLVELRADDAPVGICGLLRRDYHPDVEIGLAFVPRGRGHGYALEAARATLELARDTLRLVRLVALTAPHNRRSMEILERLGFCRERMVRFAPEGPDWQLFALSLAVSEVR